jgi:thioredoxin reductase (NADPH)
MEKIKSSEVIIVGGGIAGLSAAIYLGRSKRETMVIDSGHSMARWEPEVHNYLGFPQGVSGPELLRLGCRQAGRYHPTFVPDLIKSARRTRSGFTLRGSKGFYHCSCLLLATGIFHIPPDIPGIAPCIGHSMFFCKDCDGHRVQHQSVAVYGWTNEAVEYALGILVYSACVIIVTDGRSPKWSSKHQKWLKEYKIPVHTATITDVKQRRKKIESLILSDKTEVEIEALFTTRGDIYYNKLAKCLGAKLDSEGQIEVDGRMQTNIPGLYAAGCVTPANCQMIIAAGQGAAAAQAINRRLFERSLRTRTLIQTRNVQIRNKKTRPTARQIRKSRNVPRG